MFERAAQIVVVAALIDMALFHHEEESLFVGAQNVQGARDQLRQRGRPAADAVQYLFERGEYLPLRPFELFKVLNIVISRLLYLRLQAIVALGVAAEKQVYAALKLIAQDPVLVVARRSMRGKARRRGSVHPFRGDDARRKPLLQGGFGQRLERLSAILPHLTVPRLASRGESGGSRRRIGGTEGVARKSRYFALDVGVIVEKQLAVFRLRRRDMVKTHAVAYHKDDVQPLAFVTYLVVFRLADFDGLRDRHARKNGAHGEDHDRKDRGGHFDNAFFTCFHKSPRYSYLQTL